MPSEDVGKTAMDSWRPDAEDTQPPHLPFIYCLFNSEHLIESLPGWQRLGMVGVGILGVGDGLSSSLTQSPTIISFSATSTRPGT